MTFRARGDPCLSIFAHIYATGALVFPLQARVLEVGCAEADWVTPMLELRPDLQVTGIDWRAADRPGTVIRGDVLVHDFPAESFDVMVGISSIEHIGLGHYDEDPLDVDGDQHCMARVARWLKPGGWVYLDVPYGPTYTVHGTEYRAYDEATLAARLAPGLQVTGRWYIERPGTDVVAGVPPNPHIVRYAALHAVKAQES